MSNNTTPPAPQAEETLFRARMAVSAAMLDAYMDALSVMDIPPSSWENVETGEAWIETFDADEGAINERALQMARIVEAIDGDTHCAEIATIARKDWAEAWKAFFHCARVSDRIVIQPAWERYDAQPEDVVIKIDPGMSFGTGLHQTTRSCLAFLDRYAQQHSLIGAIDVVDLGCGSGILSIAAAKLGYGAISAIDFDPQCIISTAENIKLNGIPSTTISSFRADVLKDPLPKGRVVLANILAPILVEAAPRIAESVRVSTCSALVLSGILDSQFGDVAAAYAKVGFALDESWLDGEWRSGAFSRK